MVSFITQYVRRTQKTLKYEFAFAAFAVWLVVTVRVFISGDGLWIEAQGVNYATITTTVWLYITAAVGIQAWQNTKATEPDSKTTTIVDTLPEEK